MSYAGVGIGGSGLKETFRRNAASDVNPLVNRPQPQMTNFVNLKSVSQIKF
jgi:hypothetical protein